jgi:hypothetical protein
MADKGEMEVMAVMDITDMMVKTDAMRLNIRVVVMVKTEVMEGMEEKEVMQVMVEMVDELRFKRILVILIF